MCSKADPDGITPFSMTELVPCCSATCLELPLNLSNITLLFIYLFLIFGCNAWCSPLNSHICKAGFDAYFLTKKQNKTKPKNRLHKLFSLISFQLCVTVNWILRLWFGDLLLYCVKTFHYKTLTIGQNVVRTNSSLPTKRSPRLNSQVPSFDRPIRLQWCCPWHQPAALSLSLTLIQPFNLLLHKKINNLGSITTAGIPASTLSRWLLAASRANRQSNSSLGKYQLLFKGILFPLTCVRAETNQTHKSISLPSCDRQPFLLRRHTQKNISLISPLHSIPIQRKIQNHYFSLNVQWRRT